MNRALAVLIFFMSLLSCVSQDFVNSDKYNKLLQKGYKKGFIVTHEADTLNGLIRFRFSDEISTFWFFDEHGNKKYMDPIDITFLNYEGLHFDSMEGSLYQMIYDGEEIDLIHNVSVTGSYNLSDVMKSGLITMTGYAAGIGSLPTAAANRALMGKISSNAVLYLRYDDVKELFYINQRIFEKEYSEIFKRCDELINTIENGAYIYSDLPQIVEDYDNCLTRINE